tara:strand:+ start:534 stop:1037 length:504 start_codon:yes stop_codon:yes gene_type:complete
VKLADTPDLGSGGEIRGGSSPSSRTIRKFKLRKSILLLCLFLFGKSYANDYYDYPFHFIVDACEITNSRKMPEKGIEKEMLDGRNKYRICMNFIMALSTTLNSRCLSVESELKPEEAMTYADLSEVKSTKQLINEIILYYNNNLHFRNQIAWIHASKAISQKWPCRK